MLTKRLAAAVLSVATLALAAGCGAPGHVAQGTAQAKTRTAHAARAKAMAERYGMGALLKGTSRVVNDLPHRAAGEEAGRVVDLRAGCSPVANQGHLGSCTAFSIVKGLREFLEIKALKAAGKDPAKDFVPLSAAYLYYLERSFMNTLKDDSGAYIFMGMNVLRDGVAPDAEFPYPAANQLKDPVFTSMFLQIPPSAAAAKAAPAYKVGSITQLTKLSEFKKSLEDGYPVVFGTLLYDSFFDTDESGMVPVPNIGNEKMVGGHAILAVGYDDNKEALIVRNSWGDKWADKGYCYIPYVLFDDRLGIVSDAWTAR